MIYTVNYYSLGTGSYGGSEKRRKPMQLSSLTYLLDDSDVIDDLKIINKNKAFSVSIICDKIEVRFSPQFSFHLQMNKTHSQSSTSSAGGSSPSYHRDTRIEDGKLFYDKRCFKRGQSIQVEKSGEKFAGLISAIGTEAIWVRRTSDSTKIRIYLTQLSKGKYVLKRRAV